LVDLAQGRTAAKHADNPAEILSKRPAQGATLERVGGLRYTSADGSLSSAVIKQGAGA
jgi:hypothetical protein